MKKIALGKSNLQVSQIGLGCMTLGGAWDNSEISKDVLTSAFVAVKTALENGINLFDHADIYTRGKSEIVFSEILASDLVKREDIIIQSKCGIRLANDLFEGSAPHYDFSYDHIMASVDNSLKRLKTDYLDVLLLHRPDALVEPEEVAKAFEELKRKGKVREFGISNHNAMQTAYLQSHLTMPLITNQLEVSLLQSNIIDEGVNVNSLVNPNDLRSGGTLEYCRQNGMTIQAWSPLAGGKLTANSTNLEYELLANSVKEMAYEYQVSGEAILVAWLLRHPAAIQPIIGTKSPVRILESCKGAHINLTREQWYRLYNALPSRKLL